MRNIASQQVDLTVVRNRCRYCGNRTPAGESVCSTQCRAGLQRMRARLPIGRDADWPDILPRRKSAPARPMPEWRTREAREKVVDTGHCAICGASPGVRRLNYDHDHTNGKLRGMLCHGCNVGLGHFKDSAELLRDAARYLDEHAVKR